MLRSVTALALAFAFITAAHAEDFEEFSSKGLPGSKGIVVRVSHPAGWKKVQPDDELALAELRGPQGPLTGILQVARTGRRAGTDALCHPERARTILQHLADDEADTRVTDVFARTSEGRPGFEIRYERNLAPEFLLVRSVIACLKDSRVLVSCGATGETKKALAEIEPVCRQVLDSLSISEE
ncbi:MAG: hypothetical protein JWQ76_3219 [Ramlibacter sp.]|nr:hypothetical protein [Ramlibacter sp.]